MFGVTLLLIFLSIAIKLLASYIKSIRTGDSNESDLTYWMFSYDFKSNNKAWFPEDDNFLKRKRKRNALIFVLYIGVFLIRLIIIISLGAYFQFRNFENQIGLSFFSLSSFSSSSSYLIIFGSSDTSFQFRNFEK